MSDSIISVENLSKRYIIGHQLNNGDGLRHVLEDAVKAPFRMLRGGGRVWRGRSREEFWALRDVTFDVKPGEVVGIIGRNGAGKSTLLKLLSRITEQTTGRIRMRGRVASLLEVGTGFHPELTGRENIFLNGAVLGMSRVEIKSKFDEIVAFSGVEQFLDTPVKRYSSGMYVRLAFAVAAHLEPEILIVDEVLAVGDAEFQKKCLGKMEEVASRNGRTILFVSHNLLAVRNLCQRALLLDKGRIAMDADVGTTLERYAASGAIHRAGDWERPDALKRAKLSFESVSARVRGKQPKLTLALRVRLRSNENHKPAFLAIDILDATETVLMQAIPTLDRIVDPARKEHDYEITIALPALIPGDYAVTAWAGSAFTETLEVVRGVVGFEVIDSPMPERTHPHHSSHGFLVPPSSIEEREGAGSENAALVKASLPE